ncbi:MAG: hypothetical protein JF615_01245 [Asticcacaulis sp.]|nr:hypothetical protein [Asticcacaulis sp.]
MRLTAPLLSLTLSLLAAGAASAQFGPPPPPDGGVIGTGFGQNVFFSPAGQPFRAPGSQPYPLAAWFAQADADKDGKISHEEFLNDSMAFFDKLDLNHDHYVNSPENTNYETAIAPEITRMDPRIAQPKQRVYQRDPDNGVTDPTAGRYVKQIVGASQYGLIDEPQPVRAADANIDFRVSIDEWLTASQQRFSILDVNGDDAITLDELPKTPAQLAAEAPPPETGKKKHFFSIGDH